MVVFCPLLLEKSEMQKFVQFQGKSLPFTFFLLRDHCFKNCIMHSSICTNGYFSSCYVDIHARKCSWRDAFVSKRYDLLGQASFTACVRCDQCTFHTSDPKLRFNYCWMDKITSKSTLYFSSFINNYKKKLKSWTFTKCVGGQRINKVEQ